MLKNKLSSLLSAQFPEFTIPKYGNFISFLELYYEYIEKEQFRAFDNLRSIDDNLDLFTDYIKSELGIKDIPPLSLTDDKLFLKHIKEFYSAKGSEESFRILFRHLFGKEIEIFYPKDYILKASDGKWKQEVSVLVTVSQNDTGISASWLNDKNYVIGVGSIITSTSSRTVTGYNTNFNQLTVGSLLHKTDTNEIIGKIQYISSDTGLTLTTDARIAAPSAIQYKSSSVNVYDLAGKYVNLTSSQKTVELYVSRVRAVNNQQYEIFLEQFYHNDIENYSSIIFEDIWCVVQPTLASLRIAKKGNKFRLGQIFDLDNAGANGAKCKIVKVNSTGGIESVQLVSFGSGYTQDSYFNLTSSYTKSEQFDPSFLYDYTSGFVENGTITTPTYFVDYADIDYAGELIGTFYSDYTVQPGYYIDDLDTAIVELQIGSIRKYPGSYTSGNGFLSDAFVLQDNYYYQIYSYVIQISEDIQLYKNIIKNVLNPAGYLMFGEYNLNNTLDLSSQLESIGVFFRSFYTEILLFSDENSAFVEKYLHDTLDPQEDANSKVFEKVLTDLLDSPIDDNSKLFNKGLSELIEYTEFNYFETIKILEDYSSVYDLEHPIIDPLVSYTESDYWLDYCEGISYNSIEIDIQKQLTDSVLCDDDTVLINYDSELSYFLNDYSIDYSEGLAFVESRRISVGKHLTDSITDISDVNSIVLNKVLNDEINITDNISIIGNTARTFNDSTDSFDTKEISLSKPLTDSYSANDISTVGFNKHLSDSTVLYDSSHVSLNKRLTDSITETDTKSISLGKKLTGSISVSESKILSLSKPLTDSGYVSDTGSIVLFKSSIAYFLESYATDYAEGTIQTNF
jgi:hypothetical protein